jgi:hypothetical protein
MNATPINNLTVSSRGLVDMRSTRTQPMNRSLEEVRDYLKALNTKQDPEDIVRPGSHLAVFFENGVMTGRFLTPSGLGDQVYSFSSTGAAQLASEVLPSHFFRGLRGFVQIDDDAKKLASLVWNKCATQSKNNLLFRTVNYKDPVDGAVKRMIRAVVSEKYADYSNLQYVQTLLDHGGDLIRNANVLEMRVTDDLMRLRVAIDPFAEVNSPIRMVELWNSEVAKRRVSLRSGIYKLICTNGMGHWDKANDHSWVHRGETGKFRDRVESAVKGAITDASGVVHMYEMAINTVINKAFEFMTAQMTLEGLTPNHIAASVKALDDTTTTPGSKLASVVDAITLAAQAEDLETQDMMEVAASKIMFRGLRMARNNIIEMA